METAMSTCCLIRSLFSNSAYIELDDGMTMNDELESMLKEVVMINMPGTTQESHKNTCHNSIHAKI
jgi:hypothetical protein